MPGQHHYTTKIEATFYVANVLGYLHSIFKLCFNKCLILILQTVANSQALESIAAASPSTQARLTICAGKLHLQKPVQSEVKINCS